MVLGLNINEPNLIELYTHLEMRGALTCSKIYINQSTVTKYSSLDVTSLQTQ